MKKIFALIILIIPIKIYSLDTDFDFTYDYYSYTLSKKLYLHPTAHYNYSSKEEYDFEKNYMSGYAYRTSVGSISDKDFYINQELVINHQLNDIFWFRTYILDEEGFHLPEAKEERYLELQAEIGNNYYISTMWSLYHHKDELNAGIGFMKSDDKRENFIKLDLIWEDFIYDDKNIVNGYETQNSRLYNIMGRYEGEKWYFFMDGKLSTGYERVFEDSDLLGEDKRKNHFSMKINLFDNARYGYKFVYSDFFKERHYDNTSYNYLFYRESFWNNFSFEKEINKNNSFFSEFNYILRYDKADAYLDYNYSRIEYIPVIGWKYFLNNHELEASYKEAFSDTEREYSDDQIYSAKERLGLTEYAYTYNFDSSSFFRLSISFFSNSSEFGGGSMRMGYYF